MMRQEVEQNKSTKGQRAFGSKVTCPNHYFLILKHRIINYENTIKGFIPNREI